MLQLLRESPPGFGGIERVAHELALNFSSRRLPSSVYYIIPEHTHVDPLPVDYARQWLPCLFLFRLAIPLPSRRLLSILSSSEPLHVHLPCPTLLFISLLSRIFRPYRTITIHWHSFLVVRPTVLGLLVYLYQQASLLSLRVFSLTVTTSPNLCRILVDYGLHPSSVRILPCSLSSTHEAKVLPLALHNLARPSTGTFRIITIGRIASYKRIDWVIDAISCVLRTPQPPSITLDIIGTGPNLPRLRSLASKLPSGIVRFHNRVIEDTKLHLLAQSDLLILPSDQCNEAFGIVQLEAMSCAVPSISFRNSRSGAFWVSQIPDLPWVGTRSSLPTLLTRLSTEPDLLYRARLASYQRYHQLFSNSLWKTNVAEVFPYG